MEFGYAILIPILPLVSFLVIGLLGNYMKPMASAIIGTLSLATVAVLSYQIAINYFWGVGLVGGEYQTFIPHNYDWLVFTDTLRIKLGTLIDPISAMMLVVISTISLMVHIYSIGYMHGEKGFSRFFAFLSLFSFSMLGLVLATNIFQMYIFWELVGASSFLLIGFYYEKPSAVAASKKAFIVTRFADLGFLIGILLLSFYTKTFDFQELTNPDNALLAQSSAQAFMGLSVISWAMLLIFIGGAGKSAMFPLHIWLPDAMEGPTPVSALIHAATMVVAGVYLVARLFVVYHLHAENILVFIGYVGAFTSLFAAVIACTQFDIKRVLAFSTLSQIGYMMLSLGVSDHGGHEGVGYMASMFHLFTHAMFKALLFLGAGSVIHAVHSNQMYDMGGLRKYLPITHITFLIACLAISGVPGFSGFFSKDEILVAAYHSNKLIFASSMFVAGLTAFYMFRLYFRVFWNEEPHYHHTPHESPLIMTIPLMLLAVASIFAGYLPFSEMVTSDRMPFETHLDYLVAIPSVVIGLIGIAVAYAFYRKPSTLPDTISTSLGGAYKAVYNKFYIDEVYLFVTKKIIFNNISQPIAWFDRHVIDASMDGVATIINLSSVSIRKFQSGNLHQYGFVFVSGAVGLMLIAVYFIL